MWLYKVFLIKKKQIIKKLKIIEKRDNTHSRFLPYRYVLCSCPPYLILVSLVQGVGLLLRKASTLHSPVFL